MRLTVLLSLTFILLGTATGCAQQDSPELLALAKEHGRVRSSATTIVAVWISTEEGADALIPRLHEYHALRTVGIGAIDLSDEHLQELGSLSEIVSLSLGSCNVDDEDLRHLTGLTSLRQLYLTRDPIEGEGLRYLERLENLVKLDLGLTQIRGPGLEYLRALPHLNELSLSNTPIDDTGLDYVVQLDNIPLRNLSLHSTNITPEGLMKLVDLHWLEGSVGLPDDITGTPIDMDKRRAMLARFYEAHVLSKRAARTAGEDVPEDIYSPFESSYRRLYPNREPGEE